MGGANNTTVGIGVLSGALVTCFVTILNTYVQVDPPLSGEVSAALTVIVTALVQWFSPPRLDA